MNGARYWSIGEAMAPASITSSARPRSIPLRTAKSKPSLSARICAGKLRLSAIFMILALPISPIATTRGPISSSTGRAVAIAGSAPATMMTSFP
jgi:hypothetical protein